MSGWKHPQQQAMEAVSGAIFQKLLSDVPEGLGLTVLVFDFAEAGKGFMSYASNARREDMVAALRECADKLEGNTKQSSEGGSNG